MLFYKTRGYLTFLAYDFKYILFNILKVIQIYLFLLLIVLKKRLLHIQ